MWTVNSEHRPHSKVQNVRFICWYMWPIESTHGDVVLHQYNHDLYYFIVRRPLIALHLLLFMYAFNIAIETICDVNKLKMCEPILISRCSQGICENQKTTTKLCTKHINKTSKLLDCNRKHLLAKDSSQFLSMALSGFRIR